MKTTLLFLLCVFVPLNLFGQSESAESNSTVTVEEISLARDDGSGQPGEIAANFKTNDVPIYCLINLSSARSVTVKMNLVAVSANGIKPGSVIITVNYKTSGKQNRVWFKASPDNLWSAGKYRVDLFVDGKASGSQEFKIQKSAKEYAGEKQTPPKTNSKSKPTGRKRKN